MEAQITSPDGFAGRQPLLLVSRLHGSSHCLFIASNRLLNAYNRVRFSHAILCYYKSTDSVTFSIDSSVTSVRKYINSMRKRWNSTAIKRMRERLKPGPFFSSPSSGLGTRLAKTKWEQTKWEHTAKIMHNYHNLQTVLAALSPDSHL